MLPESHKKTGRKRGRLTEQAVKLIVAAVDAHEAATRITWGDVQRIAKRATRHEFTRQGLEKNDDIRKAYHRAVDRHRNPGDAVPLRRKPMSVDARVEALEAALTQTQSDLSNCDQQLVLITHNARLLGISMNDLLRPMSLAPKGATAHNRKKNKMLAQPLRR